MGREEKDNWDQQLTALREERKKTVADQAMDGTKRYLKLDRIDKEIKVLEKKITGSGSAGLGVSQHSLRSSGDHGRN